MTITDLLERLSEQGRAPRRNGQGWSCRCPAHDDMNPSLSVTEGSEGRILLHCHAGCRPEAVADALGISLGDLQPERIEAPNDVARYRYEDETGRHLFDVVRQPGKRFTQQPADGRRGAGCMDGVRRVPYRLPKLLHAIAEAIPIYVCEGEKDVHAIERAGGVATTNPGGAKKWRSEFDSHFHGATVTIIADQDPVGYEHAELVRKHLSKVARTVRVVHPLAGKDAADHLRAGHTLDHLREDALPPAPAADDLVIESSREFASKAQDDIPCIIRGLWPEGSLGFISGPPKARKTWLALQLAVCVTTGKALLGRFVVPQPRPVLYVALEGHRAGLRHRYSALTRGAGLDPEHGEPQHLYWIYKPRGINLADPEWADRLARAAAKTEAAIVVIDVLRAAAQINENDAKEFASLRANLNPILDEGRSVAILHHFGKLSEINRERAPAERMSGTGAMRGAADIGLYLTAAAGSPISRVAIEARDLATPDDLGFEITGHGTGEHGGYTHRDTCSLVEVDPSEEANVKAPARDIKDWLAKQPLRQARPGEIATALDVSDRTIRARRESLEKIGVRYREAGAMSQYYISEDDR